MIAAIAAAAPHGAAAQSTEENAVVQSSDAFGRSVGNERTGLYSSTDVRGFDPVEAGNARIEGLYFDQVSPVSFRLVQGNVIRVGISAQRYPFPAPTGLVDYALSKFGSQAEATFDADINTVLNGSAKIEAKVPLAGERLGLHLGIGMRRFVKSEGGYLIARNFGATAVWRPYAGSEVMGFAGGFSNYADRATATLFPAGNAPPPQIRRQTFFGQDWADRQQKVLAYGALAKLPFGGWRVEAGLFRSERRQPSAFADLLTGVMPDGRSSGRTAIADANNFDGSTSGEFRLVRSFGSGALKHALTANLRGRSRDRRFGGSVPVALGPSFADRPDPRPRPYYVLGAENTDTVRQTTWGAAYALEWAGRGSFDVSLAKSSYRKTVDFAAPGVPTVVSRDKPMLWSAMGSVILSRRLAFYGGVVQGQEEALIAPDIATNRAVAPPAIRTRQYDGGLRYAVTPDLSLVVGVFQITKPYFNLDPERQYRQLGTIRNRGIELSLAGQVAAGLTVVAGTVLLDPRISGEAVAAGLIGDRPVGQIKRRSILNLDWRTQRGQGPLSLDIAVESLGSRTANARNTFSAPAQETINIGARYRFTAGSRKVLVRPQIQNLLNDYGWVVSPSGGFTYTAARTASVQMIVDF